MREIEEFPRHAQPEIYYMLAGHGVVILEGEEHGVRNTGTGILRLLYAFAADSFAEVETEFSSP